MKAIEALLTRAAATSTVGREDMWVEIFRHLRPRDFLELGVLRGRFAERILRDCASITRYYMLDPWRHLEDWNKPSNIDQPKFDVIFSEAMARTEFARARRIVLRGKTTEMIDRIPDASLDVAYVDGDHTLRGIAIDLIRTYPKIRPGGLLTGDDYTPTIWQHAENFEPTLVCPFAAYFAESVNAPIFVLPHDQFAIVKPGGGPAEFRVIDTTRSYGERTLLWQIAGRR
jgi:hypothetical protein